jgi:hypothetical protein
MPEEIDLNEEEEAALDAVWERHGKEIAELARKEKRLQPTEAAKEKKDDESKDE